MGRLDGKIALVTGGGSGIGRAAARLFAREGAKVAVVGRRRQPLRETVRAIVREEGIALAIPADLSKPREAALTVRQVEETLGPIQVLFNNHGVFEPGSVTATVERRWDVLVSGAEGALDPWNAPAGRSYY